MSTRWMMVQYVGNMLRLPVVNESDMNKPFGSSVLEHDVQRIVVNPFSENPRTFVPESELKDAEVENAKLREVVSDGEENARLILGESRALEAENAKLRELVRELWDQAEQNLVCDENCPYGTACDWMESDVVCVFKRRMRELGVEVDA